MAGEAALVAERVRLAKEDGQLLDLSECGLMAFPQAVSFLLKDVPIMRCFLNNNELKSLSSKINAIGTLEELNLSHNRLKTLPLQLSFANLTWLDLSFNLLTQLPPVVFTLSKLKHLSATDNQITTLTPADFNTLPDLQTLELDRNPLEPGILQPILSQLSLPSAHRRF